MARNEQDRLEAMQKLTMLQKEEEAFAGQFNKGIQDFASIETEDMLAFLSEITGQQVPEMEEDQQAEKNEKN